MSQDVSEFQLTADHRARLGKTGGHHKYDHGHAVIVSGPPGRGGAARLAARGALRVGAGVVTVLCSPDNRSEHAAHLDAVMVKTYNDDMAFDDMLAELRPNALCIGPALGVDNAGHGTVAHALKQTAPVCLDADGITLLARDLDAMAAQTRAPVVITPHEGELRRIIPDVFVETTCRATLARAAARRTGFCVLFKGPDTVVAQPEGACCVVRSAPFAHAPWLATAGSGDVLSGIITGLMARGFDPFEAAGLGANLHLRCADIIGPGLIAEDIPEALPHVLRHILDTP